jgi:Kef-type K+ transport system membrane component KefB
MDSLAITLLVVFAGIVAIPPLSRRTGLPVIVIEIVFGVIIGKSLLNLVPEDPTVDFFSSFGLVYLMFLGGLETEFARLSSRNLRRSLAIAGMSIAVPFLSGFALGQLAGVYPPLLGTIFCTTSLGLTLPMLKESRFTPRFSRILMTSVVLVDVVSLFVLAFVLIAAQNSIEISFLYSLLTILSLFLLPWLIRLRRLAKLRKKLTATLSRESYFDTEVRLSFALIFLLAAISYKLGFHSIIGAFLAGLIASEILPRKFLKEERLQSFGYGFFIPIFFIFTGARVNLAGVFSSVDNLAVLLSIIAVGMLTKVVGVFAAAKLSHFKARESLALGIFHSARLSLIVAAADISLKLQLIDDSLFAMLIILAVVSATLAPTLGKRIMAPRNEKTGSAKKGAATPQA